eukprot:TRINITY_DN6592_c0_g1_i1.p1 TRINITY_DN6592_c0_g1~~TRINITY_DN6592_c0_g1_i1.p1  ORF type:complete len:555 (-),score=92.10 TRINITY_DN6592_c0_g1_i1:1962-3626(-)
MEGSFFPSRGRFLPFGSCDMLAPTLEPESQTLVDSSGGFGVDEAELAQDHWGKEDLAMDNGAADALNGGAIWSDALSGMDAFNWQDIADAGTNSMVARELVCPSMADGKGIPSGNVSDSINNTMALSSPAHASPQPPWGRGLSFGDQQGKKLSAPNSFSRNPQDLDTAAVSRGVGERPRRVSSDYNLQASSMRASPLSFGGDVGSPGGPLFDDAGHSSAAAAMRAASLGGVSVNGVRAASRVAQESLAAAASDVATCASPFQQTARITARPTVLPGLPSRSWSARSLPPFPGPLAINPSLSSPCLYLSAPHSLAGSPAHHPLGAASPAFSMFVPKTMLARARSMDAPAAPFTLPSPMSTTPKTARKRKSREAIWKQPDLCIPSDPTWRDMSGGSSFDTPEPSDCSQFMSSSLVSPSPRAGTGNGEGLFTPSSARRRSSAGRLSDKGGQREGLRKGRGEAAAATATAAASAGAATGLGLGGGQRKGGGSAGGGSSLEEQLLDLAREWEGQSTVSYSDMASLASVLKTTSAAETPPVSLGSAVPGCEAAGNRGDVA